MQHASRAGGSGSPGGDDPFPSSVLRDAALKPSSRLAYNKNFEAFMNYSQLTYQQLDALTPSELDWKIAHFIEHLYHTGRSFSFAEKAMAAVRFRRPNIDSRFGVSMQTLRGWRNIRAPTAKSYPPITWELCVVFAVLLAREGYHAEAVGLLVAFDCYLRVSELVSIRYCDVVMRDDPRMGRAHTGMAIALPQTKTGPNQWVSLKDPAVADLLTDHISRRPSNSSDTDRVFPFAAARLRRLLRLVATAAGVGDAGYVPHSLRHGGATADFQRGATVEQVMFRGRWRHMESARRYVQQGKSALTKNKVAPQLNQLGQVLDNCLVQLLLHIFDTVPRVSAASRKQTRFNTM